MGKQMKEDSRENRHNVSKGYKWVLYTTVAIFIVIFIAVLLIPSSEYPDQIDHGDGKIEKLDDNKK